MASHSTLTGAAGEFFVMYRLLRLGLIAALAPDGVPNADLLVSDLGGKQLAVVQVKSRNPKGGDKGWHMKKKHETLISKNLFYCFVDFPSDPNDLPRTFIVPSKIVAAVLTESHRVWLETPGKDDRPHKDTDMRRLLPDYSRIGKSTDQRLEKYSAGWLNKYLENWDSLFS